MRVGAVLSQPHGMWSVVVHATGQELGPFPARYVAESVADGLEICERCHGSTLLTDENGVQWDDPCPECLGYGAYEE